ncbi:hypothetical protein [Pyrobaculum neutrophilum]|uniref:Uncharacterized protein n=1 Tax=Pyrobaculum neutrophilum (strain DSM 2338 / JCM 9278 / NBRC 100436 / V24Sta) TaxID=444157 RepID=B1Y8L1_PYRNV|nr:hypothetical protein [Pyrobaculum neutrophilum]ACB40090.1 hypothetical protein Tneu_1161 [Pyrobaculum neutrophilum V24Sta]
MRRDPITDLLQRAQAEAVRSQIANVLLYMLQEGRRMLDAPVEGRPVSIVRQSLNCEGREAVFAVNAGGAPLTAVVRWIAAPGAAEVFFSDGVRFEGNLLRDPCRGLELDLAPQLSFVALFLLAFIFGAPSLPPLALGVLLAVLASVIKAVYAVAAQGRSTPAGWALTLVLSFIAGFAAGLVYVFAVPKPLADVFPKLDPAAAAVLLSLLAAVYYLPHVAWRKLRR